MPHSEVSMTFLLFYLQADYDVLVQDQCHDAIIRNEIIYINLFGLALVKDKCKTQKMIDQVFDDPIMKLDKDLNIFLVTSVLYICRIKLIHQKHVMKLSLFLLKTHTSGLAVSCNNTQTIVSAMSF